MISALVPSRGRPEALAGSIASLLGLAAGPDAVEVVAAIDPDDAWRYEQWVYPSTRILVTPERYGHARIHEYMNALAAMASGEWLLNWNDDAVMLTPGWDAVIASRAPGVLWPSANHHPGCNIFPAWPAEWTRLTGHMSLAPNCDSWIQDLGERLGRQERIPVEVFHDRHNQTGSGRFDDATYAEGTALSDRDCTVFRSAKMTAARERDASLIRGIL